MTQPDLSQLRDIHLPAAVPWWPPAVGWWIVAGVLVLGFMFAVIAISRRRKDRWRRAALLELQKLRDLRQTEPVQSLLNALSVLLRRVAITRYPNKDVASLHGDAWLAFLDRSLGESNQFQSGTGRHLASGPYMHDAAMNANDLDALFSLSEKWIRKLPRQVKK